MDPSKPTVSRYSSICMHCGNTGLPVSGPRPGSFLVEILCWFFFCFPGLIYTAWRITCRKQVCAVCRNPGMIPATSPRGLQMVNIDPEDAAQKRSMMRPLIIVGACCVAGALILIIAFIIFIGQNTAKSIDESEISSSTNAPTQ